MTTKRSVSGILLMGLGFVFCPCHLPITLPLLGAWLGGTAVTGFLGANIALITGLSTVLFVGFMGLGWWLMSRKDDCELDLKPPSSAEVRYGTQK